MRKRGITALHDTGALRFHPRCYYRRDTDTTTEVWPALIAAVTDLAGTITGAHRTWLDPSGDKAPVDTPRRAMGHLAGHGVRFGVTTDVLAANAALFVLRAQALCHRGHAVPRPLEMVGVMNLQGYRI